MGHAEYASKSLAVLMKLAAMLRIVPAMQFVLDKLAALLRGKGSDELLADEFLDEASCITRSAVVQRAAVLQPSSEHAIAVPKTNEPAREQLIHRRWLETGSKMWNPIITAPDMQLLIFKDGPSCCHQGPARRCPDMTRSNSKLFAPASTGKR